LATPLVLFGVIFILATITLNHSIPYPVKHTGFFVPAFAAIVLGLAFQPAWSKPIQWSPLIILGQTSYALFLLHFPILIWCCIYSKPFPVETPWDSIIAVFMTIVAALLAYWIIEKPSKKWLSGKTERVKIAEQRI
jgi:peptidoglycan/LPS O-acetylase OafA/YrhL